jgi:hypothetical protein
MYKIRNITSGKVILGDLGLVLTQGQEQDLDAMFPRDKIDASNDLTKATDPNRRGGQLVAILHKDVLVVQKTIEQSDIEAMERRIRRTIAAEFANTSKSTEPTGTVDELRQKLDLIIEALAKGGVRQNSDTPSVKTNDTDIDDSASVEIQSKLINRLSNKVESRVETKEETRNSDVQKHADELGDFLGL